MKKTEESIQLSKQEMEALLDLASDDGMKNWICPHCGTLHPTWEWAKRKSRCPVCKDRPSMEDLTGKRNETTPADWRPPIRL